MTKANDTPFPLASTVRMKKYGDPVPSKVAELHNYGLPTTTMAETFGFQEPTVVGVPEPCAEATVVPEPCAAATVMPEPCAAVNLTKMAERIAYLKEFIALVDKCAKAKGIDFDRYDLPFTKSQLLFQLQKRYPQNFKIKKDSFEAVWRQATKEKICASSRANEAKGNIFLNDVLG